MATNPVIVIPIPHSKGSDPTLGEPPAIAQNGCP
jgi:hypothetical protein